MASEALSSAIMIIGAVLGAAVLITAILPAIFSAGDTFGTVSSSAEQKMKTDFRIVNTYAHSGSPGAVTVWLKNVGATRVSVNEIDSSDVFFGVGGSIEQKSEGTGFTYSLKGAADNGYWDVGETLEIDLVNPTVSSGAEIYFAFVLPNSVRRTTTFSTND